jgi:ABC-type sugar transport system ATPase subunit
VLSLLLERITCDFPGVRALEAVSLQFIPGEVHGLAGENGAGKSTLIKVVSGMVTPTQGTIQVGSQVFSRVRHPRQLGIRAIPQEPTLAPDLSIAENLLMGQLPRKRWGQIDWSQTFEKGRHLMGEVGLNHLSPKRHVKGLGIAECQLIEVARALAGEGRIFLFDEPTSSLSAQEVAILGGIIRKLQQTGKVVVYVSHRLDEIFSFCQRVSVLRDGQLVETKLVSQTTPQEVIRLMVGRDIAVPPPTLSDQSPTCLKVEGIGLHGILHDISFEVRGGEILGIGGLVGAGRTELLQGLFGIYPVTGTLFINGTRVRIRFPQDAIAAGIVYVPEDRTQLGLALNLSIADNLAMPNLRMLQRFGFIRSDRKRQLADRYIRRLDIRCRRLSQLAQRLSGGNQQKIVLGKWLARNPLVLLLDEPTRGIDIGAKAEIYTLIRELASSGIAVVLVSSELPELLALSDRILVMREGQISGELTGKSISEEAVMLLATPGIHYQKVTENPTA